MIGQNENDISEDSAHAPPDEADHILTLLQKYPLNDTAPEVNAPLTDDELRRMFYFIPLSVYYHLIKHSHWVPISPTNPRLVCPYGNAERIVTKFP
jgi:hypothetical protein